MIWCPRSSGVSISRQLFIEIHAGHIQSNVHLNDLVISQCPIQQKYIQKRSVSFTLL